MNQDQRTTTETGAPERALRITWPPGYIPPAERSLEPSDAEEPGVQPPRRAPVIRPDLNMED
jgi:hypothetical protein